jgi:hypothetical protein
MTKSRGINRPSVRWTEDEIAVLTEQYATVRAAEIAAQLPGRTTDQVLRKANLIGLKKSRETIARHARESMLDPNHPGRAHQFKPGQQVWNKGTHFTAGGRSAETRFKKGRPATEARNYVPIGSLRLSKDGYLERKITDDPNIYPARRWVAVHRLAWIEANGPVPPGHIVVFRPGMKTVDVDAITADKVECISLVENMRRNSYHTNYPKEIGQLIQLRGALVRKINHRNKKEESHEHRNDC